MFRPSVLIAIAAVLVVVFAAEFEYRQVRLRTSPSGWFAVQDLTNAYGAAREQAPLSQQHVLAGAFPDRDKCLSWLRDDGKYLTSVICLQLFYNDAARIGWNGREAN